MNIRDEEEFLGSFWDWSVFNPCFYPTKIRISDLDGIVERKGKFLVIETKKPGTPVTEGQARMFNAFLDTGVFTVLVIWGHTNHPQNLKIWGRETQKCYFYNLTDCVRGWFVWANSLSTKPFDYFCSYDTF